MGSLLLFFTANAEAGQLTTASLQTRHDLADHLLTLNKVTVCTNEEDNEMAIADAGTIATKGTAISSTGVSLPSGTACAFVKNANLAVWLTGRMIQIGGTGSPIVAEIHSKDGYAYVIVPPTRFVVASQ